MKVLLINGSSHKNGGTYNALSMVEKSLIDNGVETDWFQIGNRPVRGCIDCRKCNGSGRCIFNDDPCNELIEAIIHADGIIVGTPVYFAGPNGALCALLDRVFYAAVEQGGQQFRGKLAAAVASCYRAGTTSALDRLNKYFTFSEMPVVSSEYWNMMFQYGSSVELDEKGQKALQKLGTNMANMLKKLNA